MVRKGTEISIFQFFLYALKLEHFVVTHNSMHSPTVWAL